MPVGIAGIGKVVLTDRVLERVEVLVERCIDEQRLEPANGRAAVRVHGFSYTEIWNWLASVNGPRAQSDHLSRRRMPAS